MGIQLNTELCRIFNIRHPIFLAGMAGLSGVELAAAVSNAGGLGMIGAAYMTPESIREAIREIRQLTRSTFGVNLFSKRVAHHQHAGINQVQHELNKMRDELGLSHAKEGNVSTPDLFEEQFAVLLEEKVPVISTTFGLLPQTFVHQAKSAGIRIVAMVTSVNEAIMAEKASCDAIVAQGSEAGGHRGTFDVSTHPMGANIGVMALVPQIVDHVRIPVIAAGGIMDGRGLIASLALGAQGVQMGTRFLTALESGAHEIYKNALLRSNEESTVITRAFSGRPARGIENHFIRKWNKSGMEPLPFPIQNTITRDIRTAASEQHNAEYMSLWAGQGTRMITDRQKAGDIISEILQQADTVMETVNLSRMSNNN